MPLPRMLQLNQNHLIIAWSFLYPVLQRRAAASQPLWDDRLVEVTNKLFTNQDFITLLIQVFNREKPVQALEFEAPAGVSREDARAFAGSYNFVEGWIRDVASSVHDAPYVNPAAPCECADSATCNMHYNTAKVQGQTFEPDQSSYLYEQQAKATQMGGNSSSGVGSADPLAASNRPPDTWVGQNVPPLAGPAYAGAPQAQFQSTQPTGLAQLQAEKMHLPESMTGAQVAGGNVGVSQPSVQPSTPEARYAPGDEMPGTVAVSQPSTAQNTEQAAQLASPPHALAQPSTVQPTASTPTAQPATTQVAGSNLTQPINAPVDVAAEQVSSEARQTEASMSQQATTDKAAADKSWEQQKSNVN